MEGDQYVSASLVLPALKDIEDTLAPKAGDSPVIAQLRAAMLQDHTLNRLTLAQTLQSKLIVLQHLLDPR
jgi:hypothetical protein